MALKVGFIGLGIMGSRMAANLQAHGYKLIVFNRTRDKAEALLRGGATWGTKPCFRLGKEAHDSIKRGSHSAPFRQAFR